MFSASRYVTNGSPRCCAFCHEPMCDEAHRRGDRYFCNELCADACGEPVFRHPSAEDGTPYLTLVRDRAA